MGYRFLLSCIVRGATTESSSEPPGKIPRELITELGGNFFYAQAARLQKIRGFGQPQFVHPLLRRLSKLLDKEPPQVAA